MSISRSVIEPQSAGESLVMNPTFRPKRMIDVGRLAGKSLGSRSFDWLAGWYDALRETFAPSPPRGRRGSDRDNRAAIIETLEPRLLLSAGAATSSLSAAAPAPAAAKSPVEYLYSRKGNSQDVDLTQGLGGVMLEGGGTDVAAAFQWMIGRMGGPGDFLVLSSTKDASYNSYVHKLGGVNSVATLGIPSLAAAENPAVAEIIRGADAIFIAGGSQDDYINFWQDTPVQTAIAEVIARGAPIGGTSAGADVIGQFIYSALNNGVTSTAALADPFNSDMTFARDFISSPDSPSDSAVAFLNNTLVDTHFITRDRTGRMVAFLARVETNGWSPNDQPLGIGINEQTALLINPDGLAQVIGNAKAKSAPAVDFFLTPGAPEICQPGQPLSYAPILVTRVASGGMFDLGDWESNWQVNDAYTTHSTISVSSGVLTTTPFISSVLPSSANVSLNSVGGPITMSGRGVGDFEIPDARRKRDRVASV